MKTYVFPLLIFICACHPRTNKYPDGTGKDSSVSSTIKASLDTIQKSIHTNPTNAKQHIFRIVDGINSESDKKELARAYTFLSMCYQFEGNYDSSAIFDSLAIVTAHRYNSKPEEGLYLINIANQTLKRGNLKSAITLLAKAQPLGAYEKDTVKQLAFFANYHYTKANIFNDATIYDSAITNYFKAIELSKKLKDSVHLPHFNIELSVVYESYHDYSKALYYLHEANKYVADRDSNKNKKKIYGNIQIRFASIYNNLGNVDSALISINKAKDIFQELQLASKQGEISFLLAEINLKGKKYADAIKHYTDAINYSSGRSDYLTAISYHGNALAYRYLKQFTKADEELHKALQIYERQADKKALRDAYLDLAQIAKDAKNNNLSTTYYERFSELNEDYLNDERITSVHQQEIRYETALKDLQISEQKARIEIETEKRRRKNLQNIVLWIGLSMLALFTFSLYKTYKRIQRHKKHLERLYKIINEQKETILHTNKGYIGSLRELISQQFQNSHIPPEIVTENLSRIDNLQDLLDMAYLQGDQVTMNYAAFITEFCKKIEQSFTIPIRLTVDKNLILPTATCVVITLIIDELIRNASKYAFPNKSEAILIVTLMQQEDFISIVVKDNGIGLQSGFSMQQQTRGLRMVNNLVLKTRGTIAVSNENGACFNIKIHIPDK